MSSELFIERGGLILVQASWKGASTHVCPAGACRQTLLCVFPSLQKSVALEALQERVVLGLLLRCPIYWHLWRAIDHDLTRP